jgi:glycosyltransferase involved in cell wall biosynthesis
MPEVVDAKAGRLAAPDDPADLARAVRRAAELDRSDVRESACRRFGLARMVDDYERLYHSMTLQGAVA